MKPSPTIKSRTAAVAATLAGVWIATALAAPARQPTQNTLSHQAWVEQSFEEMSTIKVGMTRQQLRKVFTEPGGVWTLSRTQHTYAYRDCPSFLVDVSFKPVGTVKRDMFGSDRDHITKISKPYLARVYYN